MSGLKKAAAFLTAAIMVGSAVGCADTSYAMKADDEEVRAGIYIDLMLSEMSYQMTMMYYQGITENYFDEEVDGKKFAEYLSETTLKSTKEYVAVNRKFEELGLELDEETVAEIKSSVKDAWNSQGDLLELEGVSKESFKAVYELSAKHEAIFNYYYAEDGVEAVSQDDMQTYLNENYLRYKSISISKSTSEDEDTAKTENEENEALRDEYFEKAKDVSFDEFDKIIDEYDAYVDAQSESEDDSDSEAEDSSSNTDSTADSEDSSSQTDSDTDDSSDESAVDDSTSDTDSDEDSEADSEDSEDDSEVDPYENETMVNYSTYEGENLKSVAGKMLTEIDSMEYDVAAAYENDNAYYIIIKGDVAERTGYITEDNEDTIRQEMKGEDFQVYIDEWVAEIKFIDNTKAIKRYTPEVVYKIQSDYAAKNS